MIFVLVDNRLIIQNYQTVSVFTIYMWKERLKNYVNAYEKYFDMVIEYFLPRFTEKSTVIKRQFEK